MIKNYDITTTTTTTTTYYSITMLVVGSWHTSKLIIMQQGDFPVFTLLFHHYT